MPSDDRVQQQAISAILAAGVDDWVMLHDVLWHTTHDERTPEARTAAARGRPFRDAIERRQNA